MSTLKELHKTFCRELKDKSIPYKPESLIGKGFHFCYHDRDTGITTLLTGKITGLKIVDSTNSIYLYLDLPSHSTDQPIMGLMVSGEGKAQIQIRERNTYRHILGELEIFQL